MRLEDAPLLISTQSKDIATPNMVVNILILLSCLKNPQNSTLLRRQPSRKQTVRVPFAL